MSIKSIGKFALALTLAVGFSSVAFAYEAPTTTPGTPTAAPAIVANTMKTKEECEKMPTAERTECMKHIKETKAEATTPAQGAGHTDTHKKAH